MQVIFFALVFGFVDVIVIGLGLALVSALTRASGFWAFKFWSCQIFWVAIAKRWGGGSAVFFNFQFLTGRRFMALALARFGAGSFLIFWSIRAGCQCVS